MRHRDELTGLHANTQIPKIIGFARIAELGGDASWRDAARFFWNTVVENRSLAFGGNSEREHFNPTNDFSSLLESREGPESCNTYNMLRLSETLFRNEPAARYADYYERALYNHILASQHPEHGGYVYFTPIRPQHYRVYSQPNICFWCCVGTGMENHGKYGEFIYAHSADALWVNLFIASELDWTDRGVKVRQETAFPDESRTRLVLSTKKPQQFTLHVRHPSWVGASELRVKINGQLHKALSSPASYLAVTREWRDGDTIELELPMHTSVEALPDGSDYVALVHGPIVLAARTGTDDLDGLIAGDGRMAHVSTGAYLPLDQAPMLVGERARLAEAVEPVAGKPLTFTAKNLIRPERFQSLTLEPFFRIHDARYVMYWRTVAPENYADVMASIAASEKGAPRARCAHGRSSFSGRTTARSRTRFPRRRIAHGRDAWSQVARRRPVVQLSPQREIGRSARADRHVLRRRTPSRVRPRGERSRACHRETHRRAARSLQRRQLRDPRRSAESGEGRHAHREVRRGRRVAHRVDLRRPPRARRSGEEVNAPLSF
ncbi:MAG: glycoside hydrolase family 127 protein [Opitutus sp.]|nr:glycoside hydrolase family 127 protein [Opitutus sp.]